MNALTTEPLLDAAHIERQIVERDRQLDNPFSKDAQVTAIRGARSYRGDRLIRTARRTGSSTRKAGPLIAVRLSVLTRKTLGGLETDLSARALGPAGAGAGTVCRRRGRRVRRRRDARVPLARGHLPGRVHLLGPHRRPRRSRRHGLTRRVTKALRSRQELLVQFELWRQLRP